MNPAIRHEPFHRDPGDLASNGIEAGEDHGFRRIVDHDVHSGRGFEGADVPALTTDDATLHVVARQGNHRDGDLGRVVDGESLNGHRDDLAGLALRIAPGPLPDVPDRPRSLRPGFVFDAGNQLGASFLGRESGDLLEPGSELRPIHLELFFEGLQFLTPLAGLFLTLRHPLLALIQNIELALESLLLLAEAFLGLVQLGAPLLRLLEKLLLETVALFLALELRRPS